MDKFEKALLVLLVAFVPFYFQVEIRGVRIGPNVLLLTALMILLLWRLARTPKGFDLRQIGRAGRTLPHVWFYAGFVVWSVVAIAVGPDVKSPAQGLWHVYRDAVEMPLLYAVFFLSIPSLLFARKLVYLFLGASALSAVVGVIQFASGGQLLAGLGPYGNFRYLGFLFPYPSDVITPIQTADPRQMQFVVPATLVMRAYGGLSGAINLGAFLLIPIGVSSALWLYANNSRQRFVWGIVFVAASAALAVTYSRMAWFALLTLLAVAAIISWFGKFVTGRQWLAAFGFFFLFAFAVMIGSEGRVITERLRNEALSRPPAQQTQPGQSPQSQSIGDSATEILKLGRTTSTFFDPSESKQVIGRMALWRYSFLQILASPLIGYGTVQVPITEFFGANPSPHDMYLALGYSRGLVGLAFFLGFLFLLLRDGWRSAVKKRDPFIFGLWLGLIGFAVAGLTSSPITYPDTGITFWMSAGLLVYMMRSKAAA
jgi:hypothetical protein